MRLSITPIIAEWLVILVFLMKNVSPANILGISPYFISSHYNVLRPIFLELINQGHNLTVISAYKEDIAVNYHHIQVDRLIPSDILSKESNKSEDNLFIVMKPMPFISELLFTHWVFQKYSERLLESENLQDFIRNDESQFDLVISEDFRFAPYFAFARKYNAPLITMTTFGGAHWVSSYMGNPLNLHYAAHEFLPYVGQLSLMQRIENVVCTIFDLVIKKYYFDRVSDRIIEKHFSHLPRPLPTVAELENKVSLVFQNAHFTMDIVRSNLPNIIQIAGIHIKPVKKLPEDIQKILDAAVDGVIYFSMGSNLLGKHLPREKRDAFLKVFAGLKQTVLWKWEEESLPGQSENVIIRKWFPQSDILAHPNVRLFITHGGLLSNQEAVYRGVPLIGLPIFGDQPRNVARAKAMGYCESLDFQTLSYDSIKTAVDKVLKDPSYRQKAKELSAKITDKPMTAMETAVYWVEYVIRHRGAGHMRTPSSDMAWWQYYMIDVVAILLLAFIVCVYLSVISFRTLFRLLFNGKPKAKRNSKGKKTN